MAVVNFVVLQHKFVCTAYYTLLVTFCLLKK